MATLRKKPVNSLKKASKTAVSVDNCAVRYIDGLDLSEKERYEAKLSAIKGQDPYEIVFWSTDKSLLPSTTYMDIVNYLIFTPSPYTKEELRCYKGLDAYNQFVSGWVRDVGCCRVNDLCVITAEVLHSQRLSEKPLRPWIIAQQDGVIISAHCTCMAGLGETCTHVAASLFYIEAAVKIRDSQTVTQVPAYWKMPASFEKATYSELRHIDFTSAAGMKKQFEDKLEVSDQPNILKTPGKKKLDPPSTARLGNFMKSLSECKSKPVVLSLIPPYSDSYVPDVLQGDLPPLLTELKNDSALTLNYTELLQKAKDIEVTVSKQQAEHVEAITREQTSNRLWFRFRSGRVTASRMKAICHTNAAKPSEHLVKTICYPEGGKLQTEATKWGCSHEKTALDAFTEQMIRTHDNIRVRRSGFVISAAHPYIGASPDAIVTCDCCGSSPVEVKCPFCKKDVMIHEITDKTFCLQKDVNGVMKLSQTHAYWYQVQTQMGVCEMERAFFVVWTEKDMYVEEVLFDEPKWREMCIKAQRIFQTAILPELLGKFFTRTTDYSVATEEVATERATGEVATPEAVFCYCRDTEYGDMVACENRECKYEWFHFGCVGIIEEPKGVWYCPDCRKLDKFKRKRRRVMKD